MVKGKLIFKNNKLIFAGGNEEELINLFRRYGISKQDVVSWFKAELNNPCCENPQLELAVLSDTRLGFYCVGCDTWRFRDRLSVPKNQFEKAFDEHIKWLNS